MRPDLLEITKLVPEKSEVLDIGTSRGNLLAHLAHEKHCDSRGIELIQEDVSHCVKQGLSVIQGDADLDLVHYPDNSFDYVISSQMLQACKKPKQVLSEMLRIGRHAIVSIPNFGYWRNRLYLLLNGRMPVTETLSYQWYETPNIHFCTITDFYKLCKEVGCTVEQTIYLGPEGKPYRGFGGKSGANLLAEKAIFVLKTKP